MSIGLYPRYDQLGASSRYRFFLYFQRWIQDYGSENIALYPGMSDDYLRELYASGSVSVGRKLREFGNLFKRALNLPDKLVIEYELVPNLPFSLEKILIGKRRYILNFDDNVWVKYQGKKGLSDKFDRLCRDAAGIIVANSFLLEKVKKLNSNVILIPTVVDLEKYDCGTIEKFPRFTAVWIGTPVTYAYLEQALPMLQKVFSGADRELLVVADSALAEKRPLPGVNVRYENWSQESEIEYLQRSHIGIMPLSDDEFSRGKSAFKLLQYQAAGLPLIASPVGENNLVVREGCNGFLAGSVEEWQKAFEHLFSDRGFYEQCSRNSRQCAYEYSLQKYFPVYHDFVLQTLS